MKVKCKKEPFFKPPNPTEMNHDPSHCDPDNLRALCQRCHNQYDAKHRAETRQKTINPQQI